MQVRVWERVTSRVMGRVTVWLRVRLLLGLGLGLGLGLESTIVLGLGLGVRVRLWVKVKARAGIVRDRIRKGLVERASDSRVRVRVEIQD